MIKKIFSTGFISLISVGITFILGILIARFYGTEGKGIFTLLLLIPNLIVTFSGFSIGEGLLYFIGNDKIDKKNFIKILLKVIFYIIPLSFLLYIIFYKNFDYPYEFVSQSVLIILLIFNEIYKFALRAQKEFDFFNKIILFEAVGGLFSFIYIQIFNLSIVYILYGYIFYNLLSILLMHIKVIKNFDNIYSNVKFKYILSYSLKVYMFKILSFIENKFDLLLIGKFLDVKSVGIYSVSISLTQIYQAVIQKAISTILLPVLVNSNDLKEKIDITIKYFKLSLFLSILFNSTIIIIGKYLIIFLFGEEFSEAYIPMVLLFIGSFIKSPVANINAFFKSINKPEALYKSSIISLIVNILLCIILIPWLGIIGAAIASLSSYFLYGFQMIYKFKKETNINYSSFLLNIEDLKFYKQQIISILKRRKI